MVSAQAVSASQVADMLNCSEATFRAKRRELEVDHNFPPKLPGCNGWSLPAVSRWIETNGETYLPPQPDDTAALAEAAAGIERDYA